MLGYTLLKEMYILEKSKKSGQILATWAISLDTEVIFTNLSLNLQKTSWGAIVFSLSFA